MAGLTEAARLIIEHEGGFVNHPSDSGGATKYGITQGSWTAYRAGRASLPTSVANVTVPMAIDFWVKYLSSVGTIAPDLRWMGLNALAGAAGPGTAVKAFRRTVRKWADKAGIDLEEFNESSSPLSERERSQLEDLGGARLTQVLAIAAQASHFLGITNTYLKHLKAGTRYTGSHSPVFILGWLSRAMDPAYTEFTTLDDRVRLANRMYAILRGMVNSMPAGLLIHRWDEETNKWSRLDQNGKPLSTKPIRELMTPKKSNWMWRDRALQHAVSEHFD